MTTFSEGAGPQRPAPLRVFSPPPGEPFLRHAKQHQSARRETSIPNAPSWRQLLRLFIPLVQEQLSTKGHGPVLGSGLKNVDIQIELVRVLQEWIQLELTAIRR